MVTGYGIYEHPCRAPPGLQRGICDGQGQNFAHGCRQRVLFGESRGRCPRPGKTECGVFESAIGCTLETAYRDMRANKERWGQMDGVQGYHLVQSFAEGELTPELAHRIGLELAERLLHGQYPAVVATHLNTHCLHNHIVWDSVAMDTGRKYRSSARTYYTGVRAESDRLCRQYGLSVIESPESERGKSSTENGWRSKMESRRGAQPSGRMWTTPSRPL